MLIRKSKVYIGDEVKYSLEVKENAKLYGDEICREFTFFKKQAVDNNILLLKLKENVFVPVRDVKNVFGLAILRLCASFNKLHLSKKLRRDEHHFKNGEIVAKNVHPCFEGEDKNELIDSDYLFRYIYSHKLIDEREAER